MPHLKTEKKNDKWIRNAECGHLIFVEKLTEVFHYIYQFITWLSYTTTFEKKKKEKKMNHLYI